MLVINDDDVCCCGDACCDVCEPLFDDGCEKAPTFITNEEETMIHTAIMVTQFNDRILIGR